MTLDELLLEWSYRSEKGYPSLDNPSDVSVLKQILEQLDLPANVILKRIVKETSLQSKDFENSTKNQDTKYRGGDRAHLFVDKINNQEEFELEDGSKVIIDPDASINAIELLLQREYGRNMVFYDMEGNKLSLSKFSKTAEFGGGAGAGGGSVDTRIMESAHCYACAIAYYIKEGPINEDDLLGATSSEQFAQAKQFVDVDAELDEIEEFFDRKPQWYSSIVKATNKIYSLFPNKEYTFHRDSDQVKLLYSAWQNSLEKDEKSIEYSGMKDDKWNPADIWLFSPKAIDTDWSGNLEVLNGQIADFYEDGDLIGVSLKMIKKKDDPEIKTFNDPDVEKENYEYKGYKSSPGSANSEIEFTGGVAVARMFSKTKSFNVEIKGKGAASGKAGMEAINTILTRNGLGSLPDNKEVEEALTGEVGEDSPLKVYYDKLYYLYDRFINNIATDKFFELYNNETPAWRVGKFYSLTLIEILEDNKPNPSNEIVNDIMRYAYSSTKDSSKFIKIYELLK